MKTPDTPTNWKSLAYLTDLYEREGLIGIRDLLTKQASLSERQGAERERKELEEAIGLALYKKEKNDPRWVPTRLRGWKSCKDTVLSVFSARTQEVEGEK